ncbi:MAG: arylsulfatase [Pirellula sp.]|nr:arylsulfatase [Pirellula sp.]
MIPLFFHRAAASLQFVSLLFVSLVWASYLPASEQPNVLIIMADDLGYSDLGCYGGEIETPNLDRLADNGLRYTQFYNTARCWPSRAALLSGYYAQQVRRDNIPGVGGGGNGGKRPAWGKLLPAYLKQANYRCYHSGKWHIDGPVLASGFDASLDMRNQGNYFSSKGNHLNDVPVRPDGEEPNYYATDATAEHAIQCLKEHTASHPDKPFFQYVAFIAPHFPLHAPEQAIAKYADRYRDGWDTMREERFRKMKELGISSTSLSPLEPKIGPPYKRPKDIEFLGDGELDGPADWSTLTDEQKRFQSTKMAIHAAMVDTMDVAIGRILDQLKAMNALENTIIMFCSDNGATAEIMIRDGGHDPSAPTGSAATYLCLGPGFSSACNTPHRRHKTWVHEGGISTPLIVHWPAKISDKGALRTTPAHLVDIVPTILELTGVQQTLQDERPDAPKLSIPALSGRSLTTSFGQDIVIDRKSLWWLHEGNRALRVGDWKLVASKGEPWELYDLRSDRAEQNNLAEQYPDKVRELATLWQLQTDQFAVDFNTP